MPRKKTFNLEDKIYLSLLPELKQELKQSVKSYKKFALRPSTIMRLKADFEPAWEYTDTETLALFTRWLLKSPIFTQDKKGIHLRYPGRSTLKSSEITPSNVFRLVLGLSGELANVFLDKALKAEEHFLLPTEFVYAVAHLESYKDELVALGVVKTKADIEAFERMKRWGIALVRRVQQKMRPAEKEELTRKLYPYFNSFAEVELTQDEILEFIAHIMKHLGIEEGDNAKIISERIRKRLERRGNKIELATVRIDLEKLKKTLFHLTHLPL